MDRKLVFAGIASSVFTVSLLGLFAMAWTVWANPPDSAHEGDHTGLLSSEPVYAGTSGSDNGLIVVTGLLESDRSFIAIIDSGERILSVYDPGGGSKHYLKFLSARKFSYDIQAIEFHNDRPTVDEMKTQVLGTGKKKRGK